MHTHTHTNTMTTTPMPTIQHLVINSKPLTFTPTKFDVDQTLNSTWSHHAWVAVGCTTVLVSIATSILGSIRSHTWLEAALAGFSGYLFADFASGLYHWVIDNYGDASTPIFGSQIDEFQGHHKSPLSITKRQFANNLHIPARAITCTVLPINLISHGRPVVMGFVGVAGGFILFSQQFHAWAHTSKAKLPSMVVALQDAGVLISRSQHATHHRPPYNNNYCIVSGVWNRVLDEYKMFEALEMVVHFTLGVAPRSWGKANSGGWTEEAGASPTTTSVP